MDKSAVTAILKEVKEHSFTSPDTISDAEAFGVLIANYFEWDGRQIAQTAFYALEDANYHAMASGIADQWEHAINEQLFEG